MGAPLPTQTKQVAEQRRHGAPGFGRSREKDDALISPFSEKSRSELAVVTVREISGASSTSKCATLSRQEEQVSGPEINMARRRYQKGSLRLRGKKWTLRWREDVMLADGTVKRIEKTTVLGTLKEFPTKKLAQRAADSALASVNRFDYRPVKRATFAEFDSLWQREVSGLLKPSTARAMASHLRCHLLPFFGRDWLNEIGPERVQALVGKLAKGRSRHTVLNVLGTLWSIRKMARRWGYAVA